MDPARRVTIGVELMLPVLYRLAEKMTVTASLFVRKDIMALNVIKVVIALAKMFVTETLVSMLLLVTTNVNVLKSYDDIIKYSQGSFIQHKLV